MAAKLSDIPAAAQGLLVAVLIAALSGAAFYMYVLPLQPQIEARKKEVQQLKADNDRNEVFRRQRTEYLNRIQELTQKLESLRSIVPDEARTDEFMTMIYEAGIMTGTHVRSFAAQGAVPRDYYIELPFSLRLDGTYYSLLAFFDRLAHAQRIASSTGLSMSPPAGGGGGSYSILPSESVGATCTLTTYYNKPQAQAAPAKKK